MNWSRHLMVDFDGVLNSYVSGYNRGKLDDAPMPDAVEAMNKLTKAGYEYTVFTTRMATTDDPSKQKLDIMQWLITHGFPAPRDITCTKGPALAYIDDRAVRFTNWPDVSKMYA